MYKIKTEKIVEKIEIVERTVTLAQFVGHKIATTRERKGYTQESFTLHLNGEVSLNHLRDVEAGLPTVRLKILESICKGLGIDVYTLFSLE